MTTCRGSASTSSPNPAARTTSGGRQRFGTPGRSTQWRVRMVFGANGRLVDDDALDHDPAPPIQPALLHGRSWWPYLRSAVTATTPPLTTDVSVNRCHGRKSQRRDNPHAVHLVRTVVVSASATAPLVSPTSPSSPAPLVASLGTAAVLRRRLRVAILLTWRSPSFRRGGLIDGYTATIIQLPSVPRSLPRRLVVSGGRVNTDVPPS